MRTGVCGTAVRLDLGQPHGDPAVAEPAARAGRARRAASHGRRTPGERLGERHVHQCARLRSAHRRQDPRPGAVAGCRRHDPVELLADPDRCGAAPAEREASEPSTDSTSRTPGVRCGLIAGEVVVREVPQLDAAPLALAHARAGDLVGDPERHALADQPLGDVGGQREALRAPATPAARCRRRSVATMPAEGRQQHLEGVDGVEDRLLVLLQVAVVGERQAP